MPVETAVAACSTICTGEIGKLLPYDVDAVLLDEEDAKHVWFESIFAVLFFLRRWVRLKLERDRIRRPLLLLFSLE